MILGTPPQLLPLRLMVKIAVEMYLGWPTGNCDPSCRRKNTVSHVLMFDHSTPTRCIWRKGCGVQSGRYFSCRREKLICTTSTSFVLVLTLFMPDLPPFFGMLMFRVSADLPVSELPEKFGLGHAKPRKTQDIPIVAGRNRNGFPSELTPVIHSAFALSRGAHPDWSLLRSETKVITDKPGRVTHIWCQKSGNERWPINKCRKAARAFFHY